MEEEFKDVIEKIKKADMDPKDTKKYILAIKRAIKKIHEACKDELTDEQIVQDFLDDYEKQLDDKVDDKKDDKVDVKVIFTGMLKYGAYKRLLTDYKGNKSKFDTIVKNAKIRESKSSKEALNVNLDPYETMVSAVRSIVRRKKGDIKEKEIIEAIKGQKAKIAQDLRTQMIEKMRMSISDLDEYGFLDRYIADSNEELKTIGLSELQYQKRNPIADKQYDENGNIVKDVEDIGVIDTFTEENLQELSLEDLELMMTFWESKYFQERLGISKALETIKTLDLWDIMLNEDDEAIESFPDVKISAALKKDLAITYLCRSNCRVSGRMNKRYKKFLEDEGIPSSENINDSINFAKKEILSLDYILNDVVTLKSLMLYQLENKDIKIKKWGEVKGTSEEEMDLLLLAIENRNFRGPLIMPVSKQSIKRFFETEELDFPIYDKELDDTYCSIMSKLYLPTNAFYTNLIKKAYKENPTSELIADLAGKKAKPVPTGATVGEGR